MKNLKEKMTTQINFLIRKRRIDFKFKEIEKNENEIENHQHGEFSGHASDDNFIY